MREPCQILHQYLYYFYVIFRVDHFLAVMLFAFFVGLSGSNFCHGSSFCRDGLLEFTIPGIAAPVLATPARVHSPRAAASAEAKQQLECPPVTPSTLRPGPEHALTTRGPSKRKRSR